jgi:hypothetical protein
MNQLGLWFTATHCNGWPKLKFSIDDDLLQDYEFTSGSAMITLPVDLLDGEHRLDIELYGKSPSSTVVVNDVIVEDQLVTLDAISIDNVPVPNFVKYKGIYTTRDFTAPQALTWGIPGVWSLKFNYPIIGWILDCKLNEYHEFDAVDEWVTAIYHPKKTQALMDGFRELEDLLNNVDI